MHPGIFFVVDFHAEVLEILDFNAFETILLATRKKSQKSMIIF